MYIRKTLKGGLRVICEKIPYVKTVSVGIWSGTGSRMEEKRLSGISHFAEHMLFKGTKSKTAKDIAEQMDYIGGYLNAFTSRECTCYYAKAMDTCLEKIIDILSDMYINPALNESDIELERGVILEEINMYEDSPEDIALDLLSVAAWGDDSMAYPVSGDVESVGNIGKTELEALISKYYNADNTVVSVAGNFDENELFELLEKYFSRLPSGSKYTNFATVDFKGDKKRREKDIEQSHWCIGYPATFEEDDDIYTIAVLNNILGNGMSSRLFQNIRENRGLAYSVYSSHEDLQGAGMFYIYTGTSPQNLNLVRELVLKEVDDLLKNGVTQKEFERAVSQLKGSYIMNLESVSARMNSMGRNELLKNAVKTPEQIIRGIENVRVDFVNNMINKVFSKNYAESTVENSREEL